MSTSPSSEHNAAQNSSRSSPLTTVTDSLANVYQSFVISNASLLSSLESFLRCSFYLVPMPESTGEHSRVIVEGAYASVGLMGIVHDLIFLKHTQRHLAIASITKRTQVREVCQSMPSVSLQSWATVFSSLSCIELLCEIVALQSKGEGRRWRVIYVIEIIKACMKLVLLMKNKGGLLPQSQTAIPSRDTLASLLKTVESNGQPASFFGGPPPPSPPLRDTLFTVAEQKGVQIGSLPPYSSSSTSPTLILAELLHIFRPVVYLFLCSCSRRPNDKRGASWLPFLLSLAMDVISLRLAAVHSEEEAPFNDAEKAEVSRRWQLLGLYLMRSPLYEKLASFFSRAPSKLHTIGNLIASYREFYFYTAGSS